MQILIGDEVTELEPHYAKIPDENRLELPRNPVHVIVDNIRSAYNVGSFFRTSDAGAVEHIHLCGMSAHPPHKKIEKTSLGAFEYVPWTYYERTSTAVDLLREQGISIVAIETSENAKAHTKFVWPKPTAIIFGNEVNGVNDKILRRCDAVVSIPMLGHKNSINVATAYGVVLYEVLRQWGAL